MKAIYQIILSAAAAVLLAASCQHNEHPMGLSSGEEVSVSISAVLSGDGEAVVKSDAEPGNGDQVNRCILEVYLIDGDNAALYGSREMVKVENLKASFEDLNLITGQKYRFVLWADYVDNPDTEEGLAQDKFYDTDGTSGLQNVTMIVEDYAGNDDRRDAFFYRSSDPVTINGPEDFTLQLKRPFGQLNIITTDYGLIPDEPSSLRPAKVQLTYKNIPTGINLLTGELLNTDESVTAQEVIGTAVDIAGLAVEGNDDAKQLSFDYIFAPATDQHLIGELTMSFLQGDRTTSTGITAYTFKSLPIQRNYRTNVSGALLTDRAGLSIEVKPGFDGSDIPVDADAVSVASIDEAEAALAAGAESVTISQPVSGTIEIPAAAQDVTLTLMGLSGDITISGEEYSGMVTLNNLVQPETPVDLTIDIPNGSFMLGRGTWSNVTVSTADNTFILGEDVSISGALTVNKGNVEIYGRVENIEFKDENSLVTVFTVYDAVSLKYAASLVAQNRCAKIVLGADIDLQGSAENKWEPIDAENTKFTELDGAGHIISNLYVDNYTDNPDKDPYYYGGLFYVLQGDVRNLTIKDANVTCFRGGALVGRMDYGTVENCHVLSSEVTSFQKIGGIVGFVQFNSQDIKILNCSVDEFSVKSISSAIYSAGGLIGFLQTGDRNVLVEGCSVSNITLEDVYESKAEDKIWDLEQYYSHPFIGDICNFSKNENSYDTYTVELRNNTVDRQMTDIPVSDRPNDYTGWWAGYFNTTGYKFTPKLIIEGQVMDRWVEMKRLAAQLMSGGDVIIWRPYDFTLSGNPFIDKKLEIRKPLNITLKPDAEVTVGNQQVQNYSTLTIAGSGTITGKESLIYNNAGGTLTINGGMYSSTQTTGANGVAIYNVGTCVINDGTFDAYGYTVMNISQGGKTSLTIHGGSFLNHGKITSYAVHTHGPKSTLTIDGGAIDGLSIVNGATANISGKTTRIYNDDNYYGVYIGWDGGEQPIYDDWATVSISGGYYSGFGTHPDIYNMPWNEEEADLTITGGFFRDNKAKLADGYVYQSNVQTVEGITYNYEVVQQN